MKQILLFTFFSLLFSVNVFGQSVDDVIYQAGVAFSKEQYDTAEALYKKAIDMNPVASGDLYSLFSNLGTAQRRNGKEKEALNSYNIADELSPNTPLILNNRGTLKSNLKDYEGAIADFTQSIQADSTNEESFLYRSVIYKRMKDTVSAIQDLEYILTKINAKSIPARNNYGDVLMSRGSLTEAMAIFDELLAEKPNEPILLQNKGEVYFKQKEYTQALEYVNKAIKINPKYANAYVTRGEIQLELGKRKKAKSDFQKAIELKASNEKVFDLLDKCN